METKKNYPPQYEKPHMEIIEIVNSSVLLQTSPGQDPQSCLPPTSNNNNDFDW